MSVTLTVTAENRHALANVLGLICTDVWTGYVNGPGWSIVGDITPGEMESIATSAWGAKQ